jgi:hypothetical protein
MGQTVEPEMAGGVAVFELERFEWVAPDRIEVCGCWYGLRARRFVRPTLFLNGKDGERRRLLALLEHKPWIAEDGEPWIAAFAWDGQSRAFEGAELAVATGIDVELPPPETETTTRRKRPRRFPYRAVSRGTLPAATPLAEMDGIVTAPPVEQPEAPAESEPAVEEASLEDELRAERDRSMARLAAVEAKARHDAALGTELLEERDRVAAEAAEAAANTRRTLELELERSREAHQQALRESRDRERAAETDTAAAASALRKDFEAQLSALRSERDAVARERDKVQRRHDKVAADRDSATVDRDRLQAELAEAVQERDKALMRAGPRATWPEPEKNLWEIWTPRLVGVGLLLIFLVTVLLLFF